MNTSLYPVEAEFQNRRLDIFLAEVQKDLTRSQIKKWIEQGCVQVNGHLSKAHYKLKAGDRVELSIPAPVASKVESEDIPLDILYEDECLLVLNKSPGMVVHPAPGHSGGTLVNALLNHCKDLQGIGGVERPGIVHRLDRDTSGLLVVAKNLAALNGLARQFKDRTVKKVYLAFVRGRVSPDRGTIATPIGRHKVHRKKMSTQHQGGREAETDYEVLQRGSFFTYLRLFPKTGRTHQLRVHLASIQHPILGDTLYGGKPDPQCPKLERQALHAYRLEFIHPQTGKPLSFEVPLPPDLDRWLQSVSTRNPT
ncbi:MAG: RNA pseudouridine synthase [Nitrospinae bacterium CG11_big_fil_rev_8_21_14_0_20_56_8]|nr:MAG: RNA pseudouridine synthase [Nitrospinae bacterium CG11_big_fil_rev_8_21_14_0_20_56_8]